MKLKSLLIPLAALLLGNAYAQQWDTIPIGVQGFYVGAFVEHKNLLIVGGGFHSAGGHTTAGLATYYNGLLDSVCIMSGGSGVTDYYEYDDKLLVVGGFYAINDLPNTRSIALLDYEAGMWHSLISDISSGSGSTIYAVEEYQGDIYVAGKFSMIDGVNANKIARWDGQQWYSVGAGIGGGIPNVKDLAVYRGELYVGGGFEAAGGQPAYNIAKWDGQQWHTVGNGLDGAVLSLQVDTMNDLLIIGGGYYGEIGGDALNFISSWDGTTFKSIGGGTNNAVHSLQFYHDELYASGPFSQAGEIPTNNIARWNGWEWKPLGEGTNSTVAAMCVYQDTLFVGGYFDMAGGMLASLIAKWHAPYDSTLAVKDIKQEPLKLIIYPNPNSGEVTIEWQPLNEKVELVITHLQGKEIKRINLNPHQNRLSLNTTQYPKGVYFCTIYKGDEKQASQKLIIE